MRVLLWIIGIPVVLILLAALLLPLLLDEKALVELAAEQIREQSGAELRIDGDASLSLFPRVALATSDVFMSVPESKTEIEARSLAAGVALFPLLTGNVEIDSIRVEGLTITSEAVDEEAARAAALDTSTLSNAELDAFYAARAQARKQAKADAAGALAVPLTLEVGELSLEDVRVITVDREGEAISELQLRELSADGLNTAGRPVPITAHIVVPGQDGSEPVDVRISGNIITDLDAESMVLEGFKVRVTGATPDTIELDARGEMALDTQIADIAIELGIGELSGKGTVRYASFESPQIDARLSLTELNPALLVLAGPEAAAEMSTDDNDSGGADMPLPLHALRMIDTRALLNIDTVVVDPHRLENVTATLRVVDGVATLEPVTATVHGGSIAFNAVLNGRYNLAKLSSKGGVNDLDIGAAVAAMDAGVAASGVANLDWSLSGSGRSSAALTQSLNGPITFTTNDITLQGIAMERMLCRGVALVNQQSLSGEFPTDTKFSALSADIQLADGVATLKPLTAQLTAVSLTGNGTLDLDSQDLRASFRAQLSEALGEMDPACAINERYTDIRWPVECKGNLAGDPAKWCGVDTGEIIKDLAEGEAKRQVKDKAGKLLKKLFE